MTSKNKNKHLYVNRVGKGTPMILLHGILSSHKYWSDVRKKIPLNMFEVITPDLMGFGDSKKSYKASYSIDYHVRELERELLNNINEPAYLVGHSMGAMIALQLAIQNPKAVKKLILINPPLFINSSQAKKTVRGSIPLLLRLYTYPTGIIIFSLRNNILKKNITRKLTNPKASVPDRLLDDNFKHCWNSFRGSLKKVIFNYPILDRIYDVSFQTKIIIGKQDPFFLPNNTIGLHEIENVSLIKVKGSHHLPIEKSDYISNLLSNLLIN
jgi:pimeloyl-ACP methyl ester carboxylesterase